MLQSLPIALAQVNACDICENLLNKIRKLIHSLHQAKEWIQERYSAKMNNTFMTFESRKTSDPYRL